MLLTSCGDDDDDDSKTPSTPQSSTTYDLHAFVMLDRKVAENGYMEASYTYNDKTETIKLSKDYILHNSLAPTILQTRCSTTCLH